MDLRSVASGTARLIFYTLLAIVLMALDFRGRYVDQLQQLAGQLAEPLVLVIDWPFDRLQQASAFFGERTAMVERVEQLEQALLEARAGIQVVDDLAQENTRLRTLLNLREQIQAPTLVAELAAIDLDPFAHRIVVKRGQRHGVRIGMPVMDATGVVGQVEYVHMNTARVILLSDPDHALPVQVLPGGERTIAYGTGTLNQLRLNDLPMNSAVEQEQLVVTSGLGGQFPAGLVVGRVLDIERVPGQPFATASVQALSAMGRNRQVLILQQAPATPNDVDSDASTSDQDTASDEGINPRVEPRASSEQPLQQARATDADLEGAR